MIIKLNLSQELAHWLDMNVAVNNGGSHSDLVELILYDYRTHLEACDFAAVLSALSNAQHACLLASHPKLHSSISLPDDLVKWLVPIAQMVRGGKLAPLIVLMLHDYSKHLEFCNFPQVLSDLRTRRRP